MKSRVKQTEKFDGLFVIGTILVVVAAIVASTLFGGLSPVPSGDLPDREGNNIHKLVISELMSNNGGVWVNDQNEVVDYLEVYNGTDKTINLQGYGLSDRTDTVKWVFSDVSIPSGDYVTVGLTGKLQTGNNAPFRLSSKGGETISLVNPSSKVIDAVETVSLGKNQAMMRDGDGNWFVSDFGTPGFANTRKGLEDYHASLMYQGDKELVINEFLNRNKANFLRNGRQDGFIEFKNVSDHNVDLGEYTIGKDITNPFLQKLESHVIAPGEVLCIFTGDQKEDLGFRFESTNGVVVLSKNGRIIDEITYSNLASGIALSREDDGSYRKTNIVSPGQQNNVNGIEAFQSQYLSNPDGLMISEVMNSNHSYLAQNSNNFYDWIELRNNSGATVNLGEYFLSKNDDNLELYQLPEVQLGRGEYYIIMASGDTRLTNNSYHHANFKIGASDTLYLSKNGVIADCVNLANIPDDYSYGRGSKNGFIYMETPTPGSANNGGYRLVADDPIIETAGVYDGVSSVEVRISGQGTIRYTTDGSFPTSSSAVYSGPFTLSSTGIVKARSYLENAISSHSVAGSYIINEKHTLPVMSVSLDPSDFSYLNYNANVRGLELQAYAQLYEDGQESFAIPCSIACFGGNSRNDEKKSYALRFDSDWGAGNLIYHLFENRDNSVYDAIVLRSGSNDLSKTIFRDILCTSAADNYLDVQAYKSCVLYINGDYWGIYNIREKINKTFIADHYNVDKEKTNIVHCSGEVEAGVDGITEIFNWVHNHDMSIDSNMEYLNTVLDIDNVIDYWIYMMYYANRDVANIRYFSHPDVDNGRWKYILYDVDYGLRYNDYNYFANYVVNPYGMTGWVDNTYDNVIPRKLFDNRKFCDKWLQRLSYLLHNELSIASMTERLNKIVDSYAPEIARDRERWYGSYLAFDFGIPITYASYLNEVEKVRSFINNRQYYVLAYTRSWFGLSEARMKEIFKDLW